jgi:EmrB/QacA subfamily drug resistance transporter
MTQESGENSGASTFAGRLFGGIEPRVLKISGVVIVGALMSILDTTIVNIALEDISQELGASLDAIQWTVTAYLLALATVIPLSGWISQRFDAKKVWMWSIVLFTAGSALCGLAWSTESLIAFRVLQGLGGGLILPVGMTLLTQAAGSKKVGRVMSIVGVPMLLGPVLGPVIGGLIVENISWRWIFYVNLPIGALALLLAARVLKPGTTGEAGKLDWLGFLLGSPGIALIVFGLSESSSAGGFGAPEVWGPIVVGLLLLAGFVRHSLRADNPIVDLRLFENPGFAAAMGTIFFVGAALFGGLFVLPLFFQVGRGESPLDAGLLLAVQGVAAATLMPISGKLTDKIGGGRVALGGLVLVALGTVPFALVDAGTSTWLLEGSLLVRGWGLACTMMPSMAAAYATLETDQVPRATSALNTIQRVGGSFGTAILAVVLNNQLSSIGGGGGSSSGSPAEIPAKAQQKLAGPIASGFGHVFWWAFALTVLAAVPAAILAVKGDVPAAEDDARTAPAH